MDHVEPLIVKTMLQSKLVTDVGIPNVYPRLNAIQKSMVVDSSPKLTHNDWITVSKCVLKNHPGPISQFVLPNNVVCKVILAHYDDNGHLGMERTLGLLQERFFWPKMADDVHTHMMHV